GRLPLLPRSEVRMSGHPDERTDGRARRAGLQVPRGTNPPGGRTSHPSDCPRHSTAGTHRSTRPGHGQDHDRLCYQLGGVETGMPIVKRQLSLAGLDVRAPTDGAIRNLIERLAAVERDFKGPDEI